VAKPIAVVLGGASVTLSYCEVHHSTVGHNVKSRAHHTRIEYSYIHDSANREFDLVDDRETAFAESHAVLLGNVIVKARDLKGNKTVIHFGQDGGKEHDGTLYLVHNTIVTPYISAVVDLSARRAKAYVLGNLIHDGGSGQRGQTLAAARGGAELSVVTAAHNWLAAGFAGGAGGPSPSFAGASQHDYRLRADPAAVVGVGVPISEVKLPSVPGSTRAEPPLRWQYRHPAAKEPRARRERPCVGAYEPE